MKSCPPRFAVESSILFPMFPRLWVAASASVVLLAGCSSPDSPKAEIKLRANTGDSYLVDYEFKTTYVMGQQGNTPATQEAMDVKQLRSFRCTKVEGDKSTWITKMEKITAVGTGSMGLQGDMMMRNQQGQSETFTRNLQNIYSDQSFSGALDVVFPNRPVSKGDQWRGEVNLQGMKALMIHTFEGSQKVDGKDTFLISSEPEHPGITMLKPIRIWIEQSTGWPIKGEGAFAVTTLENYKATTTVSLKRK